ncbi:MAG TPA: ABC transporter permease subunit [Rhodocyclaceae bacterium]|nr:ABC transporter permease subunit [Rhodocyclaceae bacterium]
MIQDFRFALLLAYRSRVLLTIGLGMVFLLAFAWVGFQFSGRQPQTVALDMGLSFLRVFIPVLGILYVQELVAKEIERRLIFSSLTYPRSRTGFLLGRFAAVIMLLGIALLAMTFALALWVKVLGAAYEQGTPINTGALLFLVSTFNVVDFLVITAFATVLAVLATVPNLVLLVSTGFMVVARSLSGVIRLLHEDETIMVSAEQYRANLAWLRYILPDLGSLDIRAAALYDKAALIPAEGGWLLVMALAYAAVLLAIACWRFERRQFG